MAMVVGLFMLSACGAGGSGGATPPPPPRPFEPKSISLVPFASCEEMLREVRDIMIGEMEATADQSKKSCRYDSHGCGGENCAIPTTAPADGGSQASQDGGVDATGTNLQEAGVDEADLIKTDGTIAYAVVGDVIKVVRVWPFSQFGKIATITPKGTPTGIYVAGTKLVVLSANAQAPAVTEEVYDISVPSKPALISAEEFSGELLDSRRIGSKLYMVVANTIAMPPLSYDTGIAYNDLPQCPKEGDVQPTPAMLDAIERIKKENRARIEQLAMKDLFPNLDEGQEVQCTTAYRSPSAAGLALVSVIADDVEQPASLATRVSVLGNGGTLYASTGALYVAADVNPFGWWSWGEEIEDATIIHRFSLNGASPSYAGTGKVAGHLVRNDYVGSHHSQRFSMAQFAMSEHEGHLRVATTVGQVSKKNPVSESRVTVLNAVSPTLDKVGEVAGLGTGEKIHAIRFIASKAYVVTFKKTDPLYVVDLSDPAAPAVAGELKVPGFSTYLHPFDENRVIGLGFDADDEGGFAWTKGLKLALFDVASPANPVEISHREIGTRGSYSPAVEEHHAFTLDSARGMIALPVDIYEGGGDDGKYGTFSFAGVMLLKADATGTFGDLGKIVTTKAQGNAPAYSGVVYSGSVLRTAIIGDAAASGVITLTASQVMLNRIDPAMTPIGVVQ